MNAAQFRRAIKMAVEAAAKPHSIGEIPSVETQLYRFIGALEGGICQYDKPLADQIRQVGCLTEGSSDQSRAA